MIRKVAYILYITPVTNAESYMAPAVEDALRAIVDSLFDHPVQSPQDLHGTETQLDHKKWSRASCLVRATNFAIMSFESCSQRTQDDDKQVSIIESGTTKIVSESWSEAVSVTLPNATQVAKAVSYILQMQHPSGASNFPDCWEYACSNPSSIQAFARCVNETDEDFGDTTDSQSRSEPGATDNLEKAAGADVTPDSAIQTPEVTSTPPEVHPPSTSDVVIPATPTTAIGETPDVIPLTEKPRKRTWSQWFFGKSKIMEKCDSVFFWSCYQSR